VVIITGMSGAGKTQALRSLEDLGYFCVDNLPPSLISKFVEICAQSRGHVKRVALGIDVRGGEFFEDLSSALEELEDRSIYYEIVFLEASDETLVRRFKETRRRHPLALQGSIVDGLKLEREKLAGLRERARYIIDTSGLSASGLRAEIISLFRKSTHSEGFEINLVSFGFKKGLPLHADLVFDVRFLPNPYYIEDLRPLDGSHKDVRNYVMKWPETRRFMSKLVSLLRFLIPYYKREGKTQLVVGIGCTGGVHRSVSVANRLAEYLRRDGHFVTVQHRDARESEANAGT